MLGAADCLTLSEEINDLATKLKLISKRLDAYVTTMEYNTQYLRENAKLNKDGSYTLIDEELEELLENYGGKNE